MERLKIVISNLKKILEEENIRVSNEAFLDAVLRIYNTEKIQNKNNEKTNATEKQKAMLLRLKYKGEIDKLTKQEAHKILSELLPKK